MHITPRIRFALKASGWHLLASSLIAALSAALVFVFWYPFPYDQMTGGRHLFWLVISVDVVCGPLLTLVLFSPTKPRAELARDLALIVAIQLAALGFGLHALAQARPLALVFETDRFRVVSLADLDPDDSLNDGPFKAPLGLGPWSQWSLSQPRVLAVRKSKDGAELMKSVERSLAGVEPSQRPSWWQAYAMSVPQVLQRARPLPELAAKGPAQATELAKAVARSGQPEAQLRWLPVVSRHTTDWVVLIDAASGQVRGFAHVDGF